MKKEDLLKLIEDDDLGLLAIKTSDSSMISPNERLIASFIVINNFVKENNREPRTENSLQEHQLASRLKSIREDQGKIKILIDYDECNLLSIEQKKITSIKDILEDEDLKILDETNEELFQMKNVPVVKDRDNADFVAQRRPCKDFDKFENLFQKCQEDLSTGKRKLLEFRSDYQIKKGEFYVLNGILLYVADIGKTFIDKYSKVDGRTRCIFENGTESNLLLRSIGKGLYENGRVVSANIDNISEDVVKNFQGVSEDDSKTGFIYILRSLSTNPKIQSIDNLFKIGYSTIPVEERIKNASTEPAYLMAPVKIVTTFECYNFNPQKLEQLLHNFFGSACLNLDIYGENNDRFMPREWFIAPLEVIEKAVSLVINGGIINYRYDPNSQEIILRS